MIKIYCARGAGDKEMDEIDEPLISSDEMAVRRGTYEIDKQWYLVHSQSIEVPFKKSNASTVIKDGDIVDISDGVIGISGNRLVSSVVISGNASDVKMNLEIKNFEEFI